MQPTSGDDHIASIPWAAPRTRTPASPRRGSSATTLLVARTRCTKPSTAPPASLSETRPVRPPPLTLLVQSPSQDEG
eukprot:4920836-Pyramimonas_sp.AAC.1